MTLKKQLTEIIRDTYQDWFSARKLPLKCEKGCATCCSVNVKTTSVEGELIYDYIKDTKREQWFAEKLNGVVGTESLKRTTNGFAAICLAGEDVSEVDPVGGGQCPFLVEAMCLIYPVRPFSCRCFVSQISCQKQDTAEVEQIVLTASTVIMQLLEHVAQREYWGNLQDVLLALSDLPGHKNVQQCLNDRSHEAQARARLLSGQSIPGFLLDEVEYKVIMPLLEQIFNKTIDGKRIEDILNGK